MRMTDSQFEIYMMVSGMMQEGLSQAEALSYIIKYDLAHIDDIAWLMQKRAYAEAATEQAVKYTEGLANG